MPAQSPADFAGAVAAARSLLRQGRIRRSAGARARLTSTRSGRPTMRKSLHLALMFVLWAGVGGAKAAELRVYLIGTGGPELTPERAGMSTLIDVDGRKFLFDAGRGALQNIYLS